MRGLIAKILSSFALALISINLFAMDCDSHGCREDIDDLYPTHGNPADLIVPLLIFVFFTLFIVVSAGATIKCWKENKYFAAIFSSVICISLTWFLLNWIDWSMVGAAGFVGGMWVAIGAIFLLFGFILKAITGIFLKPARNMSTEDFMHSIASLIGGIMFMVFMAALYALIFIGLPIMLIVKIFGLG